MLKSLEIKNYQSHRDTKINFVPGITGIIGESLNGKTPILRVIQWIVSNRPGGFRFHSHFAKKDKRTSGCITTDKDSKVTLTKTAKDAVYKLEVPGKRIKRFGKLNQKVPDLVKNELNIGEINFQKQLDSHFLAASSGGQIARAISKITQTDKINSWIQTIKKTLSNLKTREGILKADIEIIDNQIKSFKGMKRIGRTISKLELVHSNRKEAQAEYEEVEALQEQIQISYRAVKDRERYFKGKGLLKQLEACQEDLRLAEYQENLILDIKKVQRDIAKLNTFRKEHVEEYILVIKRKKKCPVCFGKINSDCIRKIKKEISKER